MSLIKKIGMGLALTIAVVSCTGKNVEKLTKNKSDLEYAVPTVDMYKTKAYLLSPDKVGARLNIYAKLENWGINVKKTNPFTLSREEARKAPNDPNFKIDSSKLDTFRTGVYNSPEYSPHSGKGIFISQGIKFDNILAANEFYESLTDPNSDYTRKYCTVALQKGKVATGIGMILPGKLPTPGFWELVRYVESKGFHKKVTDSCYKKKSPV